MFSFTVKQHSQPLNSGFELPGATDVRVHPAHASQNREEGADRVRDQAPGC